MKHIRRNLKEINDDLGHSRADHFFRVKSTQFNLCTEKTYNQLLEFYSLNNNWVLSYSSMQVLNKKFLRCFNLPQNQKFKSNVLKYKKDYTGLHPTQKPIALIKDLIETYTHKNDNVLDFVMGSGTTGVACKELKRNFIGVELNKEYFIIAKKE